MPNEKPLLSGGSSELELVADEEAEDEDSRLVEGREKEVADDPGCKEVSKTSPPLVLEDDEVVLELVAAPGTTGADPSF